MITDPIMGLLVALALMFLFGVIVSLRGKARKEES